MSLSNEEIIEKIDNILKSNTEEVVNKLSDLKDEIFINLGKPWSTPFKSWWFQIPLLVILLFSFFKLAFIETRWLDSEKDSINHICYNILDLIIYFFWLLTPPIFFLIEYVCCFGKNESNRLNSDQVTDIKYCQELGSKIWAAVVVCFSLLMYVRYGFKF